VLDCETEGIYATLVLEGTAAPVTLRCHPADAIALALRTSAPIYATADALAHACPLTHSHGQAIDHPHVAQWLERVRPDDFAPRNNQE